jgi:hypothetical protein
VGPGNYAHKQPARAGFFVFGPRLLLIRLSPDDAGLWGHPKYMDKTTPYPTDRFKLNTPLHLQLERDERAKVRASVFALADEIFDRYVGGESFAAIARSLPFKIEGWKLRQMLMHSDETRDRYAMCGIERAHALVDSAIEYGRNAALLGTESGLNVAIGVNLKVAAKLHSAAYGDKSNLEVTGKVEVKGDLTLTAEQAYEKMIKGG